MKMFLTRIGENCKVVVNGDVKQSDIRGANGLADAVERLAGSVCMCTSLNAATSCAADWCATSSTATNRKAERCLTAMAFYAAIA